MYGPIVKKIVHFEGEVPSGSGYREAEPWFELRGGPHTKVGQDTGPRQVWSHREAGLPQLSPNSTRFRPGQVRLGPHVISHPPPVRARRSAARGQCGRAELALRHPCVRCRPAGAVARAEGLSWPQIG